MNDSALREYLELAGRLRRVEPKAANVIEALVTCVYTLQAELAKSWGAMKEIREGYEQECAVSAHLRERAAYWEAGYQRAAESVDILATANECLRAELAELREGPS